MKGLCPLPCLFQRWLAPIPNGILWVSISQKLPQMEEGCKTFSCLPVPLFRDLSTDEAAASLPGSRSPEVPCTLQHTGCGSSHWAPFLCTAQSIAGHRWLLLLKEKKRKKRRKKNRNEERLGCNEINKCRTTIRCSICASSPMFCRQIREKLGRVRAGVGGGKKRMYTALVGCKALCSRSANHVLLRKSIQAPLASLSESRITPRSQATFSLALLYWGNLLLLVLALGKTTWQENCQNSWQ